MRYLKKIQEIKIDFGKVMIILKKNMNFKLFDDTVEPIKQWNRKATF